MGKKEALKELKEHLKRLEFVTEFHIMSAAKFVEEKYKIQERIEELEKNEKDGN